VWVPEHAAIPGNEDADRLAKLGTQKVPVGPEPTVGIANSKVIQSLKSLAQQMFQERWDSAIGIRQAKEFFGGPSTKNTKYLLELSRDNLRTVTGLLTGHCHLRRHQYLMGIKEDPTCRGFLEEEESAGHILMWGPAFTRLRTTFLGQSIMTPRAINELRPSRLVGFIKSTGLL